MRSKDSGDEDVIATWSEYAVGGSTSWIMVCSDVEGLIRDGGKDICAVVISVCASREVKLSCSSTRQRMTSNRGNP